MSVNHEDYTRVDLNEGPSNRSFGLVFAAFFLGMAFAPLLTDASPRYWGVVVSCVFLLASIFKPSTLAWPNRIWTLVGAGLHKIVTPLVLAGLFFLVITPYALVMRLFRHDILGMGQEPALESYWRKRAETTQKMKHQF